MTTKTYSYFFGTVGVSFAPRDGRWSYPLIGLTERLPICWWALQPALTIADAQLQCFHSFVHTTSAFSPSNNCATSHTVVDCDRVEIGAYILVLSERSRFLKQQRSSTQQKRFEQRQSLRALDVTVWDSSRNRQ